MTSFPAWLDPSSVLEQVVTGSNSWGWAFLFQATVLGCAGAICLFLATWRLRPSGLRQTEQRGRRWLWALRRPLGNDPVAWRERHVIGLAPLPWLRMVPAWLGLLGVFCFSSILAYDAANYATSQGLASQLRIGNFAGAYQVLKRASAGRITENIVTMGLILGVVATMVIAVRCGGSITEEKRRKTWEDLILTPLTRNEIVYGKYRGILLAAIPHLIAYALPMFALASMNGTSGLLLAAILAGVAALIMVAGGGIGISMAYGEEGVWWEAAFQLMEMYYSETVVAPSPTSAELKVARRHGGLPVYQVRLVSCCCSRADKSWRWHGEKKRSPNRSIRINGSSRWSGRPSATGSCACCSRAGPGRRPIVRPALPRASRFRGRARLDRFAAAARDWDGFPSRLR